MTMAVVTAVVRAARLAAARAEVGLAEAMAGREETVALMVGAEAVAAMEATMEAATMEVAMLEGATGVAAGSREAAAQMAAVV